MSYALRRQLQDVYRFSIVFQIFINLVPLFSSLVVVLFLIMYGYAQVGISFFGKALGFQFVL